MFAFLRRFLFLCRFVFFLFFLAFLWLFPLFFVCFFEYVLGLCVSSILEVFAASRISVAPTRRREASGTLAAHFSDVSEAGRNTAVASRRQVQCRSLLQAPSHLSWETSQH